MNWLDIVILILLVGFTLAAFSAGLVRELVTLVSVLLGIVIAGTLYDNLAKDLLVFIENEEASEAVAFLTLFGSVYLLGQIGASVLKTGASLLMLGALDRIGGAVIGFLKGIIVVQVLLLTFAAYPSLGMDETVENSALADLFVDDFSFVLNLLPAEFDDKVDRFLDPSAQPQPSPEPTPSPSPLP